MAVQCLFLELFSLHFVALFIVVLMGFEFNSNLIAEHFALICQTFDVVIIALVPVTLINLILNYINQLLVYHFLIMPFIVHSL